MHVLVTGGLGWTAASIVAELEAAGHTTALFDRAAAPHQEIHRGDIGDFSAVRQSFSKVEGVVHLAVATGAAAYRDPQIPFKVNVAGTYNLFEAARRAGLARVVLLSAAPVHLAPEDCRPGRWSSSAGEDHLYDLTKRLQEEVARDYCQTYGMTAIALRPGHIVDGRAGVDPKGRPLRQLAYCRSGWICRYDLARACRLALEVEASGFRALPLVGARPGYERFGVRETEEALGFRIQCDFAAYAALDGDKE